MSDYTNFGEGELLLLIKERDHAAFNEVYQRTWKKLYTSAYQRLRDKEACKDIVHDVLADFWNKKDSTSIENLEAYLSTAVRYKIYNWLAKGHNSAHFVEPFESMSTTSETAESWVEAKELQRLIALWVETLPKKRRKIFELKYLEHLSTKDISERLGISQKTVQNQLLNANSELQTYLRHYLSIAVILSAYYQN
jgi:RNA polymerase sigma-70 factor (family 1)